MIELQIGRQAKGRKVCGRVEEKEVCDYLGKVGLLYKKFKLKKSMLKGTYLEMWR